MGELGEPTARDFSIEEKLRQRWKRERSARLEAEAIAERGLRDLYDKQQQLQLLEAIAVASNQAMSVEDALQFAVTTVGQYTGWPLGHVYLTQGHGSTKRLRSTTIWHGAETAHVQAQAFYRFTQETDFDSSAGLPGRVLATGAPIWIADVAEDNHFLRAQSARLAGVKAAFAFPVLVGSEVVAVLEFFAERVLAADPTLLRIMSQIGTQLGRVVERKRSEDQLIHDASHDPLTALPNRTLFRDRLTRAVARSNRHPEASYAVLFIDLDRFKVVNDSLGHLAGDDLIVQVAARLATSLRQDNTVARSSARSVDDGYDTLARLGGDEFTVLLDDIGALSEAVGVADRIQDALTLPFLIHGQEVYASASIGIVSSATGYTSAEEVLRDADLAMYRAKALGKGRYEIYDQTMHAMAVSRLTLETDLRRALQKNEFVVHYQPIVVLSTGEMVGLEALVRWRKSESELIYPDDFIHVAEDTGLILFLGMWVLREACRMMHQWHDEFPREQPLTISVNISARQFSQQDLVQQVRQIIGDTGINPATVRLEITESVTMGDAEHTVSVLTQLRALGIRISIDDFGTGYSSLSYLHRFPLDVLKIDRSFIAQMDGGNDGHQIVQTIMNLARNLGIEVVAEGTETQAHVTHLKSLGCDFGQGYFFSRPLESTGIRDLLQSPVEMSPARRVNPSILTAA